MTNVKVIELVPQKIRPTHGLRIRVDKFNHIWNQNNVNYVPSMNSIDDSSKTKVSNVDLKVIGSVTQKIRPIHGFRISVNKFHHICKQNNENEATNYEFFREMSSDTGINGIIPSLRNVSSDEYDSTTRNFVYACIHTNSKNKNTFYTVV